MADWWLSPEVYLKRGLYRDEWPLTTLLRRKAVSAYFRFKVLKPSFLNYLKFRTYGLTILQRAELLP